MSLLPLNGKREPCATITAIKIVENSGDEAVLELSSRSAGGDSARTSIALGTGRRFVEVRPVQNAAAVRACAPSQFAVMPDFFGDDVVFDARRSVGDQLYVPAENILLNFTGNGDTILMTVWPVGDQEVQALLAGDQAGRCFEAMVNITVRARLEEYQAFARRLVQLCHEEMPRNPAIGPVAQRAEQLQERLDKLFQERLPAMKTPQDNVALVGQLKELTQAEAPDNLGKYLSVAAQLRALASAQDTLAALCRCEVRLFRRELGVNAAGDRAVAKFSEKLRELARNALRKKHYTEGA